MSIICEVEVRHAIQKMGMGHTSTDLDQGISQGISLEFESTYFSAELLDEDLVSLDKGYF